MTRASLDANILVSAFLVAEGPSARIIEAWEAGQIEICLSPTTLREVADVLQRPRIFRRYSLDRNEIAAFVDKLARSAIVTTIADPPAVVLADPKDDHVIAAASEARADVIVTGDRHLLDLGRFGEIEIIPPAAFLADLPAAPAP